MTLSTGTRLGAYEVIAPIGVGGMGEVYRARDTRLKRDVALKILPDTFASDPERLARFQREAEVLAALNHPHIAQIYGLEETDGTPALVMEFVDGETLADRIARGAIPVDEALPMARQVAEALEAAHEQGIVHRDLKPANIKVRPDGTVKVLDFGLAKLVEAAAGPERGVAGPQALALSQSPTVTSPAMVTGVGTLLGTAAYMSPEQAKGRPADRRSDIWAFGCVLYEMLSGCRAFEGDDVSDTLAAILKSDPTWTSLPLTTPPALRRLLRRCLEKDARRRLQAIGEARVAIEDWLGGARDEEPAHATKPKSRTAMLAGTAAAAVAAVAVISTVAWTVRRQGAAVQPPAARFTIVPPAAQAIDTSGDRSIAISADGTRVVYAGGPPAAQQLFVRRIDDIDLVVLRGTEGANSPSISPDGRWVVFDARSDLKKVAIAGGAPITLCSCLGRFALRGSTWGPDNTILIATDDSATGLLSLPAGGGEAKVITTPDSGHGERDHFFPSMLPGGRVVLFTVVPFGSPDNREVVALDLSTGQRKTLIHGGSQAQYVETGHLVYADGATLRAVRFDPARLEVIGDPIPVVERVLAPSSGGSGVTGASDFSVSENGTLVYVPGGLGGNDLARRSLVWLDRQGREEPINAPQHTYGAVRLSPDGGRVAVDVRELNTDIWTWDFARQTFTRLTFDPQPDDNPLWTPDGRRIIFRSLRGQSPEIYIEAADGTGTAERLTTESAQLIPKSIAPDGRRLVLLGQSGKTGNDLRLLTLDGNKPKTTPLLEATANEYDGDVSPDGHWLAYASDESGRSEIYVRPFPAVEAGRWQVSTAGGSVPQWARSGRELFFIDGGAAMTSVPVQTTPTFVAGQPSRLFDSRFSSGAGRRYDVAADGKRFLMVKEDAGATQGGGIASIVVVQSWLEELKRLVPVK